VMNIFNKKSTYIIRFTLLVLILFMIGYGIMRSEVLIVLQNANQYLSGLYRNRLIIIWKSLRNKKQIL